MKIYISADIEGVTGTTVWDEANESHKDYRQFQNQMTLEVKSACAGALDAGATEIVVKDAHSTGRNIIAAELPEQVKLIRGWSEHPYGMMQELDQSFDAALMIGYHSKATSEQNPLAHTISSSKFAWIKINGTPVSEFLLNAFTASLEGIPVVFASGDQGLCNEAREQIPHIQTVAVKQGVGNSTISIHPHQACRDIRKGVAQALDPINPSACIKLPEAFEVEIQFNQFQDAFRAAFFPGANGLGQGRIEFRSTQYMDVLRLLLFI